MKVRVRKAGVTSLIITLPKYAKEELKIENGTLLDLKVEGNKIIIKKEKEL